MKFSAKGQTGVDVQGAMVDVKADGNASFQANAMTTIKGAQVMIN